MTALRLKSLSELSNYTTELTSAAGLLVDIGGTTYRVSPDYLPAADDALTAYGSDLTQSDYVLVETSGGTRYKALATKLPAAKVFRDYSPIGTEYTLSTSSASKWISGNMPVEASQIPAVVTAWATVNTKVTPSSPTANWSVLKLRINGQDSIDTLSFTEATSTRTMATPVLGWSTVSGAASINVQVWGAAGSATGTVVISNIKLLVTVQPMATLSFV